MCVWISAARVLLLMMMMMVMIMKVVMVVVEAVVIVIMTIFTTTTTELQVKWGLRLRKRALHEKSILTGISPPHSPCSPQEM